jgi:hypothetical protein
MQPHNSVNNLRFDFRFESKTILLKENTDLGRFVSQELVPVVDRVLCRQALDDRLVCLDQLELDLGIIPYSEYKSRLRKELRRKLDDHLRSTIATLQTGTNPMGRIVPLSIRDLQWTKHFLLTGVSLRFPGGRKTVRPDQRLGTVISRQSSALLRFLRHNKDHPHVLRRLVCQFSEYSLQKLVRLLAPTQEAKVLRIIAGTLKDDLVRQKIRVTKAVLSAVLWEQMIEFLLENPDRSVGITAFTRWIAQRNSKFMGVESKRMHAILVPILERQARWHKPSFQGLHRISIVKSLKRSDTRDRGNNRWSIGDFFAWHQKVASRYAGGGSQQGRLAKGRFSGLADPIQALFAVAAHLPTDQRLAYLAQYASDLTIQQLKQHSMTIDNPYIYDDGDFKKGLTFDAGMRWSRVGKELGVATGIIVPTTSMEEKDVNLMKARPTRLSAVSREMIYLLQKVTDLLKRLPKTYQFHERAILECFAQSLSADEIDTLQKFIDLSKVGSNLIPIQQRDPSLFPSINYTDLLIAIDLLCQSAPVVLVKQWKNINQSDLADPVCQILYAIAFLNPPNISDTRLWTRVIHNEGAFRQVEMQPEKRGSDGKPLSVWQKRNALSLTRARIVADDIATRFSQRSTEADKFARPPLVPMTVRDRNLLDQIFQINFTNRDFSKKLFASPSEKQLTRILADDPARQKTPSANPFAEIANDARLTRKVISKSGTVRGPVDDLDDKAGIVDRMVTNHRYKQRLTPGSHRRQHNASQSGFGERTNRRTGLPADYMGIERSDVSLLEGDYKDFERVTIQNAGIVIAAPYLPQLWKRLDLTDGRVFKDPAAAERAVHLLQFMTTEVLETPEYELVLNKILCGVQTGHPIIRGIEITDGERDVVEGLIEGMIANWKGIGKTSVQGFRESFLQRRGHLISKEDAWHLEVEERAFDMLLEKIPWGFSMIKHPWMERVVMVKWR